MRLLRRPDCAPAEVPRVPPVVSLRDLAEPVLLARPATEADALAALQYLAQSRGLTFAQLLFKLDGEGAP